MTTQIYHLPARSRGITLIEALVALFIMSIGLLGVAGLQATSISAGHASTQRSLAVFLSHDIADRIRANRTAVATFATGTTAGQNNGCADTSSTAATSCSDVQMAQEDVWQWRNAINAAFVNMNPVPTITVIPPAGAIPTSQVAITIQWTERGTAMTYTTNIRI